MSKAVTIIGGHGKVALRLAHLLSKAHRVTSIVRFSNQFADIEAASATPFHLSLENDSLSDWVDALQGTDVVVFAAGAGGKGTPDRTEAVDYKGALKVFDAIEALQGTKPRLILVSAVDIRDPEKIPDHYNEGDIQVSNRVRAAIPNYMHWKYEADKNLVKRTAFQWTILRPGGLRDDPGLGKVSIGKTHITQTIPRDDVAQALALLVDRPDAAGLAIDIVGGDTQIEEALDAAISKRETAWIG